MYGKIYESLFTGSMIGAGSPVFAVWSYVIANMKPDDSGCFIELNPRLLAFVIGDPEENISKAIEYLCSPDPNSRTKEHEGRRLLKEGEFLYKVVNGDVYTQMKNNTERRESNRLAQQRHRDRQKQIFDSVEFQAAETIYNAYPKRGRVGKPFAIRAIIKAMSKVASDVLLEKTKEFASAKNGATFIPNAATWYNQERFNDDPETWKQIQTTSPGMLNQELRRIEEKLKATEIDSNMDYTKEERENRAKLKSRQKEIKKALGWEV